MYNPNSGTTVKESNINEGDRVRIHIPYPDDDPEVCDYHRDIPARFAGAIRDHLRYNRRRGTVISARDSTTFRVEFDDPEDTLAENPPSVGFLSRDLRPLDDYGNDKSVMPSMGSLVDDLHDTNTNADRIVRAARRALTVAAKRANGDATMTRAVALELATRLSDDAEVGVEIDGVDPREQHDGDEISRTADDIIRRKGSKLVRDHADYGLQEFEAVMIAEELKNRLSGDDSGKNGGDEE